MRCYTDICLEINQRLNIFLNRSMTGVSHGNAGRALADVTYMGTQREGVCVEQVGGYCIGANVRLDNGKLIL